MRVLVIEDDKRVRSFIRRGLTEHHYTVDCSAEGEEGFFRASHYPYDAIILDVMLPRKDGFSICRQLRAQKNDTPILMLTAREDVEDKITGLDAGADDYLTKPFSFEELLARVRALMRRRKGMVSTLLKVDDLELDQRTHAVMRAGKHVELTSTEYALLEYLMINAGQVVTRTMISEHVWHDDFDTFSNVINVYINYLRKKIEPKGARKLIHSLRGTGYVLRR